MIRQREHAAAANDPSFHYAVTYAREYRYDGPRQRYLDRELDPANLMLSTPLFTTISETWSDYDGDTIYGDFDTWNGQGDLRSYAPGIGLFDWDNGVPDISSTKYYHTDMLGTTRMMTDNLGASTEPAKYTAFGEFVGGTSRRYGYAGEWGYQTDSTGDLPFMHVGHRYYDPSSGRFLQRDPIGVGGGLNVYAYAAGAPTISVDPSGLDVADTIQNLGGVVSGAGGVMYLTGGTPQEKAAGAAVMAIGCIIWGIGSGIALIDDHVPDPPPGWDYGDKGKCTRGCHNENRPWR